MTAGTKQATAPALGRLPSGRHRLTREEVVDSQRGRLLFAMAAVVAEQGYAATTIADIVKRAGVSRQTFYEHFADKQACFLDAFDVAVEVVLGRIGDAAARLAGDDWRGRVRSDLAAYLETLADEPAMARALHIESLSAGAAALERRARILRVFSERTKRSQLRAREVDPSLPELPDQAFTMHTGGLDELVREHLRTRGAESLGELIEPALAATLAMFGDRS